MNGINIQYPWSSLLVDEKKSVETRNYPLPAKYVGEEIAIIETPGRYGRFKARIIGTVTFSHSFKYPDRQAWLDDYNRHCVSKNDPMYGLEDKPKYGWVVSKIKKLDHPVDPPRKRGIIYAKGCKI